MAAATTAEAPAAAAEYPRNTGINGPRRPPVPTVRRRGGAAQEGAHMDGPTCATCPWWSRFPERVEFRMVPGEDRQEEIRSPNEKGECRKAPPRPVRDFPITDAGDWCAEHPERKLHGGA